MRGASLVAFVIGALFSTGCADAKSMARERSVPTREQGIAPTSGVDQTPPVKFDSNRAWEHLRRQVSFGPRPSGSAALNECRQYILAQLKAAGIEGRQQVFMARTPLGEMMMANIIGTIPGRRSERIILASHFDTKRASDFRFVGASDGAFSLKTRHSAIGLQGPVLRRERLRVRWLRQA